MNHTGLEFRSSILQNSLSCFSPKIHLQDLWKRFQFVLDHNLGHFKANLFDRAEIVMEAGKYRAFQVRLNLRSEPRTKLVAKTPNPQILAPVSLLASHEHLREKRLCLAGVQAIKSRFFAPIYRKYPYILSYPVFLYYAESPKVPPRVFGPRSGGNNQSIDKEPKIHNKDFIFNFSLILLRSGSLSCLQLNRLLYSCRFSDLASEWTRG